MSNETKRFAAIDLGSNNCRLVIVEIINSEIKVLQNYSQILNLGKNLSFSNEFSDEIINSTLKVFKIISEKLKLYKVKKYRCIATEACRQSSNAKELIEKIFNYTGIEVEIISSYEESRLCLKSCSNHKNLEYDFNMIFDIGGGSTEIIMTNSLSEHQNNDFDYISIPFGVVNYSEKVFLSTEEKIKIQLKNQLNLIKNKNEFRHKKINVIGSCGTITSLCAIHRKLSYYEKKKVDDFIMSISQLRKSCELVKKMNLDEKINHPCIGHHRYELLDCGIIILEEIINNWDIQKILVSDRGLREGIIQDFINRN